MTQAKLTYQEAAALQDQFVAWLTSIGLEPSGRRALVGRTIIEWNLVARPRKNERAGTGRRQPQFSLRQPRFSPRNTLHSSPDVVVRVTCGHPVSNSYSYRSLDKLKRHVTSALSTMKPILYEDDELAMDRAYEVFSLGWCAHRNKITLRLDYGGGVQAKIEGQSSLSSGDTVPDCWLEGVSYMPNIDAVGIPAILGGTSATIPFAVAQLLFAQDFFTL